MLDRRWLTATRRLGAAARSVVDAATRRPTTSGAEGTRIQYAPVDDHRADPGEVVWAWVPFEEDPRKGKDRPVLVIGRDGDLLLALQMSSQDHDKDAADEARWGRYWVDVGSGAWDRERRPSEARVDRILRIDPESVRRIGAVLDRQRFDEVAAGVRQHAR